VEFSLENRDALKAKAKRTEKSQENLKSTPAAEGARKGKKKIKTEASAVKAKKDLNKSHKGKEPQELPTYSGLTAKVGISTLPSMKAKGKITRKNLKPAKNKARKMQQERRMREPKSRPKFGSKDNVDNVDKLVSRHKQKTLSDAEPKTKNKRGVKWYKS